MKTLKDLGYGLYTYTQKSQGYKRAVPVTIGMRLYEKINLFDNGDVEILTQNLLINQELAKAIELEMKRLGWWLE